MSRSTALSVVVIVIAVLSLGSNVLLITLHEDFRGAALDKLDGLEIRLDGLEIRLGRQEAETEVLDDWLHRLANLIHEIMADDLNPAMPFPMPLPSQPPAQADQEGLQ